MRCWREKVTNVWKQRCVLYCEEQGEGEKNSAGQTAWQTEQAHADASPDGCDTGAFFTWARNPLAFYGARAPRGRCFHNSGFSQLNRRLLNFWPCYLWCVVTFYAACKVCALEPDVSLGGCLWYECGNRKCKKQTLGGSGLDQNPIIDGAVPFLFSPRKGKITFFLLHRRRDLLFSSFALLSRVYILSGRAAFRGFAHLNGRTTSARRVAPHEYLENIWAL